MTSHTSWWQGRHKVVALSLAAVLALSGAAGCSAPNRPAPAASTQNSSTAKERVEVTDLVGNKVMVPKKIDSVVITAWKGAFESFVILGRVDMVKGFPDTSRYQWLRTIYPQVKDIKNYGSFNDLNYEELKKDEPDIIFSPESSKIANEKLKNLGLTVYQDGILVSGDPFAGYDRELLMIAELTGDTAKAKEYLAWQNDLLKKVGDRVADIPDNKRKTALVLRNSETEVFNDVNILGHSVTFAGAKNLAGSIAPDKFFVQVSAEDIVKYDPDVIFKSAFGSNLDTKYQEMRDDARFKGMKALKSGDYYVLPYGVGFWNAMYESSLAVLLMAKTMYPEKFEDMNVRTYAEEFYSKFLNRKITDDDWAMITTASKDAKPINYGK